jgi:thymidylate synthase (FAD)
MNNKFEKLERPQVKALDDILGVPFKILNDGFVRVVDYMGADESIVQAARVSYGKGTKKVSEDRGLIRYLLRHNHTTPFEMCEIKLHIRVPMDTWRQWIRHRTANVNEYSTRYSVAVNAAQMTDSNQWRKQAVSNRQGSAGFFSESEGEKFSKEEQQLHDLSRTIYNNRLKDGVAREQARKDLPLSTYTEAYWKVDLHNLLHFLALRMDRHAQFEIRSYADIIGNEIVRKWVPETWDAFKDYSFNSVNFSGPEYEIMKELIKGNKKEAIQLAESYQILKYGDGKLKRNRERSDLEDKLKEMNLSIPW